MEPNTENLAARLAGSVRGLGVCDALRVELAPVQRAGLEAAVAAVLARRRAELDAAPPDEREELRDELATLERLHPGDAPLVRAGSAGAPGLVLADAAGRPPVGGAPGLVLTGPAALVLELVGAGLAAAVAAVADRAAAARWPALRASPLDALAAWTATALDCRAVEAFGS